MQLIYREAPQSWSSDVLKTVKEHTHPATLHNDYSKSGREKYRLWFQLAQQQPWTVTVNYYVNNKGQVQEQNW